MKAVRSIILLLLTATLLVGCAGQTTDPRKGGLFSYNPKAYEERLRERKEKLGTVENSTAEAEATSSRLEEEKSRQAQEKASLEAQLKKLQASIATLQKDILAKEVKTAAQKKEQHRILAEIDTVKEASRLADEMADPEEKRLELERLQKKRDDLEKEAAKLMLL